MSNRRKVGINTAQLVQPVSCWERVLVTPANVPAGSNLKVYQWVKTDREPQFSDDEGEPDEPIAIPDEPEVVEGDEEMDQDENPVAPETESTPPEPVSQEITQEVEPEVESGSKPSSPKPQLIMTLDPSIPDEGTNDVLDASLKPLVESADTESIEGVDAAEKMDTADGLGLDISELGPDGLALESSRDLSQLEGDDALMGGQMMDETGDPFSEQVNKA